MPPDSSTNARMPVVVQSDPADHLDPSLAGLEPYVHSRSSRVEGELGCLSPELLPPHQLPSLPVEWDESKQMRELVSRCTRGPRSGADVGRKVLAGEGGAGGDEVGGCALEDDPAAVVFYAGWLPGRTPRPETRRSAACVPARCRPVRRRPALPRRVQAARRVLHSGRLRGWHPPQRG